ncbi:MAG TPA: FprA family A-type flavoprotein [Candidatus Syntrophosphaera sp.]|jgi:flavorubredoxin|nr:FprA family A-type flavoprotein [Candidatus Syntrophosphaera sp.]HOH47783.1 FprA family A-type flavoprotein [Candidatus Syntrophosphaera sp.]HPW38126.1 FprA family A-type flavoprotein [Candidatus Syntrophosphaera sp.]HPX66441.1 FprA family A-type flavoprotein [Candidatus Syntrophosphaera sp.]HQC46719.1 FprA family A-type flavoprotein [Candidatus Syntrophosphaera sp.]
MKAYKLRENIWWVGGIDWDLRSFHGYLTQRGSTYNAYLIIDEKVTLIDNVKYYLYDEMLARISDVIDPAKIDIIVQNHVEMDHSSGLPMLMKLIPNAKIYTNASGIRGLKMHYGQDWNFKEIKSGDSINIGKRDLSFLTTPMVHWPDNQVTYCPQEKILFSNDAFGQHIASSERLATDYPFSIAMEEAKKYYANIVLPYSSQVRKALEAASQLDIGMIAPSHGLIWTEHIPQILAAYTDWANNVADPRRALIIYDSMWGSTEKMAKAIAQAFENKGFKLKMLNLQTNHISDIMTDVMDARFIAVGSPTLNNSILPTVAAFIYYLKGLSPKQRIGLAFGSYGWGGQSVSILQQLLGDPKECGFEMLEPVKTQYIPDAAILAGITQHAEQQLNKYL